MATCSSLPRSLKEGPDPIDVIVWRMAACRVQKKEQENVYRLAERQREEVKVG